MRGQQQVAAERASSGRYRMAVAMGSDRTEKGADEVESFVGSTAVEKARGVRATGFCRKLDQVELANLEAGPTS